MPISAPAASTCSPRRRGVAAALVAAMVVAAISLFSTRVGAAPAPRLVPSAAPHGAAGAAPVDRSDESACGTLGPPLCEVVNEVDAVLAPLADPLSSLAPLLEQLGATVLEIGDVVGAAGGLPSDSLLREVSALLDRVEALVAAVVEPVVASLRHSSDLADVLDRLFAGITGLAADGLPDGEGGAGVAASEQPIGEVDELLGAVVPARGAAPSLEVVEELLGALREVLAPLVASLASVADQLAAIGPGAGSLPPATDATPAPSTPAAQPTVAESATPPVVAEPPTTSTGAAPPPSDDAGEIAAPAGRPTVGLPPELMAPFEVTEEPDEVALPAERVVWGAATREDRSGLLAVAAVMLVVAGGLMTSALRRSLPRTA